MPSASSQRILILSPHPDDETLGCGGTLKLLSESGAQIDVLFMTRGELGLETPELATPQVQEQLMEVRVTEAREACRLLGASGVDFLDGHDGRLAEQPDLARAIQTRLRAGCYDRVFCPWPHEKHVDHLSTFRLLQRALQGYEKPMQVWLYEVWTPLARPSICVPIDLTMEAKLAAIRSYQSQLACLDYLSAFQGLAAFRGLSCPGCRYAEAFLTADRETVLGMA